jgi:hypothetical protein
VRFRREQPEPDFVYDAGAVLSFDEQQARAANRRRQQREDGLRDKVQKARMSVERTPDGRAIVPIEDGHLIFDDYDVAVAVAERRVRQRAAGMRNGLSSGQAVRVIREQGR